MIKRDASEGERAGLVIIGLLIAFAGGALAVMEASQYFWGHRYAHHVTHSTAAIWAALGVVLAVTGGSCVAAAIIGFRVNEHDRNRKMD